MNKSTDPIVIGIGGATCGGKSTLCRRLIENLSPAVTILTLSMDDYYLDDLNTELKGTIEDWDCMGAVDFEKLNEALDVLIETAKKTERSGDATRHVSGSAKNSTTQSAVNNSTSSEVRLNIPNGETTKDTGPTVILLDGIMIYQYPPLRKYFNLRYFVTLTKEVALERRLERRYGYASGEEIIFDRLSYFERYAWPCYLESLRDIKAQIEDSETSNVKYLDGCADISLSYDVMLRDISNLVSEARLLAPQSLVLGS